MEDQSNIATSQRQIDIMKKQYITCFLCKKLLIDPLACSNCSTLSCKLCFISHVLENKACPKGCCTFELTYPTKGSHPMLYENFFECDLCKNSFSFVSYDDHLKICFDKGKTTICWNCNSKVPERLIVCKLLKDYELNTDYCSEISIKEDKPFFIYISTDKFQGYVAELNNRLFVSDKKKEASVFCEETIDELKYLKIFKINKWRYLGPHYDLGILVVQWGKWCGTMIFDKNKQTIMSNNGRTKGYYLTIRESDKYLFFFIENQAYLSCTVTLIPIDSMADIPNNN